MRGEVRAVDAASCSRMLWICDVTSQKSAVRIRFVRFETDGPSEIRVIQKFRQKQNAPGGCIPSEFGRHYAVVNGLGRAQTGIRVDDSLWINALLEKKFTQVRRSHGANFSS